jgi:hypothetical protein
VIERLTFGKLDRNDLYVIAGDPEGREVEQKLGCLFSQIFNREPGIFSGVITTPDEVEVIKVHRRRFSEVQVGHMFALMPPKGKPVVVSISTLYQKDNDGTARLLKNFKDPSKVAIFTGDEEVIDFSNTYKVKVVVKVELDLRREYGYER